MSTSIMYIYLVVQTLVTKTLLNMALIFVSEVNNQLKTTQAAGINLLNGMHEGILILSCSTKDEPSQFRYCNKSARKLISTFLGPIEDCHGASLVDSKEIQRLIMQKEGFNLIKPGQVVALKEYV